MSHCRVLPIVEVSPNAEYLVDLIDLVDSRAMSSSSPANHSRGLAMASAMIAFSLMALLIAVAYW